MFLFFDYFTLKHLHFSFCETVSYISVKRWTMKVKSNSLKLAFGFLNEGKFEIINFTCTLRNRMLSKLRRKFQNNLFVHTGFFFVASNATQVNWIFQICCYSSRIFSKVDVRVLCYPLSSGKRNTFFLLLAILIKRIKKNPKSVHDSKFWAQMNNVQSFSYVLCMI